MRNDPETPMTPEAFNASLIEDRPPADLPAPLTALWWAGRAEPDWDRAHALVQDEAGPDAAWVHAYLHRVEGDPGNADYWYRQAGRAPAEGPLAAE